MEFDLLWGMFVGGFGERELVYSSVFIYIVFVYDIFIPSS